MLQALLIKIVEFSARRAWAVLAIAVLTAVVSSWYVATNFAINTDISKLLSTKLDWRKNQIEFEQTFPANTSSIIAVIDGPSPELAEDAARRFAEKLKQEKLIRSVRLLNSNEFFQKNGLLFLNQADLKENLDQMASSTRLLYPMAQDPSLKGVMDTISLSLRGVQAKRAKMEDLVPKFNALSDALEDAFNNRPSSFSWRAFVNDDTPKPADLRQLVDIDPVLDYNALEPGEAATDVIRKVVDDLKLPEESITVRLTGSARISDEEFGTLKEDADVNGLLTVGSVLVILWFALHSGRIIGAVFFSLVVGLAATAAIGLALVGAFNPISIAFFVLFVGIGVDFGLQFSVGYRAERYEHQDLFKALISTASTTGVRLALAAMATAAGFLSFLPTAYRGLSELGEVAGVGMLIAFFTSITILPALLSIVKPPAEPDNLGYNMLAPVDHFLERHRMKVLVGTLAVVLAGAPLLYYVRFDFNPMNLRSKKVESVATSLDLQKNPANASPAEVMAPSLDAADAVAKKLQALPEVAQVLTLSTFLPDGQDEKLNLIQATKKAIDPVINPANVRPAPSDDDVIQSIQTAVSGLDSIALSNTGDNATAPRRLSNLLFRLAKGTPQERARAAKTLVVPLNVTLATIRNSLLAQKITKESLPKDFLADWLNPNGKARVSILPKGDMNVNEEMSQFADAVLKVAPDAVGEPISIQKSADSIVLAFIEAAVWALMSIAVLLYVALRRISDVIVTLVPLLLAGVVTLEMTVVLDLPLNFANIIALPLLLGVGVAFKIYYVMAWREGKSNLLASPLTRAVFYSGMTTAIAFGSLWFSNHPGTSSMGELLALSLVSTMAAATLFQPLLMGPPVAKEQEAVKQPPATAAKFGKKVSRKLETSY